MRTRTLPIVLLSTLTLHAQQVERCDQQKERIIRPPSQAVHSPAPSTRAYDAPIWSENFENGLNGWEVDTPQGEVTWQLTSTGNTNGYTCGPLESTTGYPGGHWISADSDQQGTAGTPESTTITSPPILGQDTLHYALLLFEQSFRQLNDDQTLVEVSGNGGLDWTTYAVNTDVAGNASTPDAPASQHLAVNISSALANGASDIRVRFHWISTEGFTYSWQVDDVALVPALTNDLVLHDATWADWASDGTHYAGMPCTIYPVDETRPLHFLAHVQNNGSHAQTNVRFRVDVEGPGTYTSELNSAPITLAAGDTASLRIDDYTLPAVVGDYSLHMRVVQDQTDALPEDNAQDQALRVDPYVFARDQWLLESSTDDGGGDYEMGNRFWVQNYGKTLYAVDVALGPGTEAGAAIWATVYDGTFGYVGESDFHTVSASEINTVGGDHFIRLPLLDPAELDGDNLYLVCVSAQTTDHPVFTGISGTSPAQSSMLYRSATNQWYYVTNTPMVRMDFGSDAGIADHQAPAPVLHALPSLFTERTEIILGEGAAPNNTWQVCDATGRTLRQGTLGASAGGGHLLLDGADLPDGVLIFLLHGDAGCSSLRLVHQARR